jgi:hypothetical protein
VLERADDGWTGYLTEALKEFVLSTSQPRGSIDQATVAWLVSALSGLPPKTAVALAREVVQEARYADQVLLDFIKKGSRGKPKSRAAMACRRAPDPCVSCWPEPTYEWGPIVLRIGDGLSQVGTPTDGAPDGV